MLIQREELAWAAGFVDGEGHFGLHKTRGRPTDSRGYGSPELTVAQCDRQVLDRLQQALNLGVVGGPYTPKKTNHNLVYLFYVHGFERVQAIICLLWPWLSPVKRKQVKRTLHEYHIFNSRPKLSMGPKPKTPTCHPNQPHFAKGLCSTCYQLNWRQQRKLNGVK